MYGVAFSPTAVISSYIITEEKAVVKGMVKEST
jgi:hypothetical protein